MHDQNNTGRSVGFFSLSVIIHGLLVFGILAGAAYRAMNSGGSKGDAEEVTMEVIDSSGESQEQATEEAPAPAPVVEETPVVAKPVIAAKPQAKPVEKPVEKAKPVVAAVAVKPSKTKLAVQKLAAQPEETKAVDTETQDSEDAPVVAVAADPVSPNPNDSADSQALAEEAKEEAEKEQKPAAVVAAVPPRPAAEPAQIEQPKQETPTEKPKAAPVVAADTAAAAAAVKPSVEPKTEPQEETTPVAAAAAAAATRAQEASGVGQGEGTAKGNGTGETPTDAKAFTDLRQKPGNRPPRYPMSSRRAKQQGQVELSYFVNKQGAVEQIHISKSSGYAALDNEATQAIRKYKFYPGQEGWASHPVTFSLGDGQQIGGNNK